MADKKSNRTYTKEFIQQATQLVRQEKRSVPSVARSLGIPGSTLTSWLRKYPAAHGAVAEQIDLVAEVRHLQDENRQLKLERDILKKLRQAKLGEGGGSCKVN
jgi:transposase-like protein